MNEKLLPEGQAAARLGMPRTTFREKYEAMGLFPVVLGSSIKSYNRWLESEVNAFIEQRIKERDEQLAQRTRKQREILKLVSQQRRA